MRFIRLFPFRPPYRWVRCTFPGRGFAVALLLLAGCVPKAPDIGTAGVVPGGVPIMPEHTLSPGDQFDIRFPFSPDDNDRVTVADDGTVEPKLIGRTPVGGLTLPDATKRLNERYAALLRYPELSLTMRRFAPEVVYVDGWVARPGLVRSAVPLTVARAIAQAGGAKTGASTSQVLILRGDNAGHLQAYQVGLGSYAGAEGQDPLLKSFDVVYVPQTAIAAVSSFVNQYARNLPFTVGASVSPRVPSVLVPPQTLRQPAPAPVVAP